MKTIFLHGLGQDASAWNKTVSYLGVEAICPNFSDWLSGESATYQTLYRKLETNCGHFEDPINLCGLSLGAVLALQYGLEHPEKVNSLVLLAPQYAMPRQLLKLQNFLFRLMPEHAFQSSGLSKNDMVSLCSSMMELDFTGQLSQLTCHTLVACGANDKANKLAAYRLYRLAPNAEMAVFQDAGHEVNREAPSVLAHRLKQFWNREI